MAEPLNAEELATAKGQMLIAGSIANNRNAKVDIPTMLEGVRRLFATIDVLEARIAALEKDNEALQASRDRYKAALETVVYRCSCSAWDKDHHQPQCTAEIAARALQGAPAPIPGRDYGNETTAYHDGIFARAALQGGTE